MKRAPDNVRLSTAFFTFDRFYGSRSVSEKELGGVRGERLRHSLPSLVALKAGAQSGLSATDALDSAVVDDTG